MLFRIGICFVVTGRKALIAFIVQDMHLRIVSIGLFKTRQGIVDGCIVHHHDLCLLTLLQRKDRIDTRLRFLKAVIMKHDKCKILFFLHIPDQILSRLIITRH